MPVPIFLCRSYCIGLPKELEESAIIDGCSRTKILYKIVLPLMRPILAILQWELVLVSACMQTEHWFMGLYIWRAAIYYYKKTVRIPIRDAVPSTEIV